MGRRLTASAAVHDAVVTTTAARASHDALLAAETQSV